LLARQEVDSRVKEVVLTKQRLECFMCIDRSIKNSRSDPLITALNTMGGFWLIFPTRLINNLAFSEGAKNEEGYIFIEGIQAEGIQLGCWIGGVS
jgi:hypothetical protein